MADKLNNEIIIVTGSNGFIGKAIAKKLSEKYRIIGFDQKTSNIKEMDSFAVDISSDSSISSALEKVREKYGNKISSVIHLAAYYSFTEETSPDYNKITVKGTEKLIELLQNFEVEQFVFSSTMLVHKPSVPGEKINENSPVEPSWAYPASKVAAEKVLNRKHGKIPLVNLRIAGVYDDRCHSVPIANQIMRIYEKQFSSFLLPGDSTKGQSFIHLEDLVEAINRIVEKRLALPQQIDMILGEPQLMTYGELQREIGALIHSREWGSLRIPVWFAKFGSRLQHKMPFIRKPFVRAWMIDFANDHYDLDVSRAQTLLDWKPQHNLQQTLPLMIRALQENPIAWYKENKLDVAPNFTRILGRMPGDEHGFKTPSQSYIFQLNALNLANILWGLWLIFDSFNQTTGTAMFWSEIVSGLAIMVLSGLAFLTLWQWPRWVSAFVGLWILIAPLIFWVQSSANYSIGNLIGFLIIVCGAVQPNRSVITKPSTLDRPPGWDYNPSSWPQRIPIITLALLGFFIARYMAAFQLEHINSVWDPLFGNQTETVLKSDISKAFPISDAGLGAFSYLLDAISGIIGDKRRWRTMPWMVILFGIMIIPPGVTSIALVILQPVGVNAWCFLCLLTAFIMLLMVAPALDEVVATVQFLRKSHKEGKPFWRIFLQGEAVSSEEGLPISEKEIKEPFSQKIKPSLPKGLALSTVLGMWLMLTPTLFDIVKPASDLVYFSSALLITFSIIALAEIARPVRIMNLILAVILVIGIWMLSGSSSEAEWAVTATAIAIFFLSIPKGKFKKHFGTYDKLARWPRLKQSR